MKEGLKAFKRRSGDPFWPTVLAGNGLDVGRMDGRIKKEWYPSIQDLQVGTGYVGVDLRKFKAASFDFIHAGECLEHEGAVFTALLAWLYLLKPGGHLVLTVPDFSLYEKGVWPSKWDSSHKWCFSITPGGRQYPRGHVCFSDILPRIPWAQVRRMGLADSGYDYNRSDMDQTMGNAESSIEVVIRRMPVKVAKRTFRHSGARGDLIYSMPTIKALGGGKLYVNAESGYFSGPMSKEEMASISEFLRLQPFIESVEPWNGQVVDVDLDAFRETDPAFIPLTVAHMMRFGVSADISVSWIDTSGIPEIPSREIVISRTDRYHSPLDWDEIAPWAYRACFVGSEREHADFKRETGIEIPHRKTETWMELAGVIRGSRLFVGNQSFAFALAEAMKHPRILEVCSHCPNCDPGGDNGHTMLSGKLIGKYLEGIPFEIQKRMPRSLGMKVATPRRNEHLGMGDVSCVVWGDGDAADGIAKSMAGDGAEVIRLNGGRFEAAVNNGVATASRSIICVVDVNRCCDRASVIAVIQGLISTKSGAMSLSQVRCGAVDCLSGSCFAVTRSAYERAGMFNPLMGSGRECMIEMSLRFRSMGISCRTVGVRDIPDDGCDGKRREENLEIIRKGFGVLV